MIRAITTSALFVSSIAMLGCVRRTLTITSDPSGALVWLNDREIGRTPVDVDFVYYGDYDVRLVRDGYEPLLTNGKANPPIWDNVPLDFVAEMSPMQHHAKVSWHFEMQPRNDAMEDLVDRAHSMRAEVVDDLSRDDAPGQ